MFIVLPLLDIYKLLDDVLGQGAHTTVKSCVKLATNQEYAVKVRKLPCWNLHLFVTTQHSFGFYDSEDMLNFLVSSIIGRALNCGMGGQGFKPQTGHQHSKITE